MAALAATLIVYIASFWWSPVSDLTIGSVLRENGFAEFRPPSNLVPPGTWVTVSDGKPTKLSVICLLNEALGMTLEDLIESATPDTELFAQLDREMELDAGFTKKIKASSGAKGFDRITMHLTNAKVVEIPDTRVMEGIVNRTGYCRNAIQFRLDQNENVTMIKSALIADVKFQLETKEDIDATFDAKIIDNLASELRSKVVLSSDAKISFVGKNLIWGIRDDAKLARVGMGLPQTGGFETNEGIISPDFIISEVDQQDQARRNFPQDQTFVSLDVPPIQQVGANDCWATVYAMMLSWKDQRLYSKLEAVRLLGEGYMELFRTNVGLTGGKEWEFANKAELEIKPPASYQLKFYVDEMTKFGPLWIVTGDGINAHAKLLVGIYGSSVEEKLTAYQQAVFEFVDPATGTYKYQSALDFMEEFEKEARFIVDSNLDDIDLRWQIMHFGDGA
ncbi:hypothetical protein N9K16_03540 [Alphaproteobacteria bacterium]|nr:hypothetical protein [Alphaproteobacteria bacterium]